LIEERPRRHHNEKGERRAAEPDVQRLVDVLRRVADQEGEEAGDAEEGGAEAFGEELAFEILDACLVGVGVQETEVMDGLTISPS
jgi:hypothetical protein